MGGDDQTRSRVGGLEHPVESAHDRPQAAAPAPQPRRAFVALLGRGRAHLILDVGNQPLARVSRNEQTQRLVEAAAIQVGIQIAQTRRQAAAHLPVG